MYLLAILSLFSGIINVSIDLQVESLDPVFVETSQGGLILTVDDGFSGTSQGFPDIPYRSELVPLASNTEAVSINVGNCTWETVDTGIFIRPLPRPWILSRPVDESIFEPQQVYSQDAFWPDTPVRLAGTGYYEGVPNAQLIIAPFRYNPVNGELQKLVQLEVSVVTEPCLRHLSPAASDGFERMLIITDEDIREPFDSLAHWRTAEGILTEVVTTDAVYSAPGVDNAEKIRNYIIQYRQTNGLDHVLLGGDTNYIPCRFAFPMSYEWNYGREDNMPCDLYFSDLDGNWNLDGDTIWGEVADSVDLYPDVHVGRAPCENIDEAWVFWNKVKAYETATDLGHLDQTILAGGVLWDEPFTDEAVTKQYIKNNYIPDWFTNGEYYVTTGNYDAGTLVAALDQGAGYVNLNDHGWITSVGCLNKANVDGVDSDGRFFGMMYSIGCWTSAFDSDCVAEHFINNPNGCGVSYIGNSSYGWGSPGNPLFGYSDRFDRELFDILFEDPVLSLGEVLSEAKETYIPFAGQENCYRCVLYMVNLLGDPSMRTFRREPVTPIIQCPSMVTQYTAMVPVTVDIPGDYSPDEITVCIHDEDLSNYLVTELDASGHTVFELLSPPVGDLTVTVTGTDVARTSVSVPNATGPFPAVTGVSITAPGGFGHPVPGTSAEVAITLSNIGNELLSGVELTASLSSGPGSITQSSITYGDLAPGGSSQGSQPLVIVVNEDAFTGQILHIDLEITANQGFWNTNLPLLVYAPGLYFSSYFVDDSAGGNGNGYAEPGESFELTVDIANSGLLEALDVWASLSTEEAWLTWNADSAFTSMIEPDETCQFTFSGTVDPSAPDTAFPVVTLSTSASPLWYYQEEFLAVIGEFLVSDDFENGPQFWDHSGTGDLWHLSQAEAHSGEWAWWCGNENPGVYQEGMNCSLLSPFLYLAPQAELSFWSCFDVDLYGSDGLYVIMRDIDSSTSDTLDFIGAGGLLGTGCSAVDGNMMWLPRTYDLSFIEAGTRVQIEFAFYSDTTPPNEGAFHIDDITIDGYLDTNSTEGPDYPLIMGLPCPNPSTGTFAIPLNAPSGGWTVQVYDISGRIVHGVSSDNPFTGQLPIQLDHPHPGVYLIKTITADGAVTAKTVITEGVL